MTPWKVASGVTLIAVGLFAAWALRALDYLAPYAAMIVTDHGPRIALEACAAVAAVFGGAYWLAVRAGLAAVGSRMAAADARARDPERTHDPDLAAALDRDRRGAWKA